MPFVEGCGDCEHNPGLCDTHTEPGEWKFVDYIPPTTVVHWNDRPAEGWTYIGRSIGEGYFGNPFLATSRCGHSNYEPMGRAEAIRHYREWFYDRLTWDDEFKLAVHGLRGRVLVCHCKPMACHGDVIAEYLNSL